MLTAKYKIRIPPGCLAEFQADTGNNPESKHRILYNLSILAKMQTTIKIINLSLPFKLGSVNCYLIKTHTGYVLIDTGCSNARDRLVEELERAGCLPGDLKLVLLTHGDFDHAGNAAFLRKKYKAVIAIHHEDSGMVEHGDIFYSRKKHNVAAGFLARFLFRFSKSVRFKADLFVDEGSDLTEYGLSAKVLHLPGHSRGSIGIIANGEEFFCGDLLVNGKRPRLNTVIDDPETADNSVRKIVSMGPETVYPGHGKPFSMNALSIHPPAKMKRSQPLISQYPTPR